MRNLLFVLTISLFVSCYPESELLVDEADIVATRFDEEYFENNNPLTYHMPDTIGVIGGEDEDDQVLTREEMDFILDQVRQNLSSYGLTPLDTPFTQNNLPDVILTVENVIVTTVGAGCLPWYGWWGYYPWWPGWGWGGGYCYPTYAYSYTTGTLLLNMIDVDQSTDEEFFRVWHAGINGLIRSSEQGNQQFVTSTIDQAFDQSPYLSTSN
jgi:hypothetical protein